MFDSDSDPEAIPTEHLEHEITTLAAHIYAATCRWLVLIAEFDRRECHLSWGFHSTTAWLAWTCGLTVRAAREHVRVARDLRELPLIRASFARGELSYSKVRAVTRAATAESEAEMLELAHNATAAQLERAVRAYRSAIAVAENRPPPDTFFAWGWDDDGTLSVRARLPADQGALLIEAMHHGRRLVYSDSRPAVTLDGERPGPPVTNADALGAVCEAALSSSPSATSTGGDRYQVVLHLDTAGRRELEEGSTVSEQTARRMHCDASLVAVERDRSSSPAVGRRARTIPSALRRELKLRDRGCRFPGCTARFVDAHHIHHWADGGETSAANLVSLCRRHHRADPRGVGSRSRATAIRSSSIGATARSSAARPWRSAEIRRRSPRAHGSHPASQPETRSTLI